MTKDYLINGFLFAVIFQTVRAVVPVSGRLFWQYVGAVFVPKSKRSYDVFMDPDSDLHIDTCSNLSLKFTSIVSWPSVYTLLMSLMLYAQLYKHNESITIDVYFVMMTLFNACTCLIIFLLGLMHISKLTRFTINTCTFLLQVYVTLSVALYLAIYVVWG